MLPTPEPSQTRPSRTSRKRILQSDGTFSQSFYTHDESQSLTPLFEYIEPPSKRRRGLSFEVFQDPIPALESPQRGDSNDIFETQNGVSHSLLDHEKPSEECTTISALNTPAGQAKGCRPGRPGRPVLIGLVPWQLY